MNQISKKLILRAKKSIFLADPQFVSPLNTTNETKFFEEYKNKHEDISTKTEIKKNKKKEAEDPILEEAEESDEELQQRISVVIQDKKKKKIKSNEKKNEEFLKEITVHNHSKISIKLENNVYHEKIKQMLDAQMLKLKDLEKNIERYFDNINLILIILFQCLFKKELNQ